MSHSPTRYRRTLFVVLSDESQGPFSLYPHDAALSLRFSGGHRSDFLLRGCRRASCCTSDGGDSWWYRQKATGRVWESKGARMGNVERAERGQGSARMATREQSRAGEGMVDRRNA